MTSVLDIQSLALFKQLDARGISLPLEVCKDVCEAVTAEVAAIGEEIEKRIREREPA